MTGNPFPKLTIIHPYLWIIIVNETMKILIVKAAFPHARIIVGVIWDSDYSIRVALAAGDCAYKEVYEESSRCNCGDGDSDRIWDAADRKGKGGILHCR